MLRTRLRFLRRPALSRGPRAPSDGVAETWLHETAVRALGLWGLFAGSRRGEAGLAMPHSHGGGSESAAGRLVASRMVDARMCSVASERQD